MAKEKKTDVAVAEEGGARELFSGLENQALLEALHPAKVRALLLFITGQYTLKDIASVCGVAPTTVGTWMSSPNVQTVIKELQKREWELIDSSLKSLRMKAVNTVSNLMDSDMDMVRLAASKDILDRTGHKSVQQVKVDKTVTNIESQLKNIVDVTVNEEDVIDISDVVESVKRKYDES